MTHFPARTRRLVGLLACVIPLAACGSEYTLPTDGSAERGNTAPVPITNIRGRVLDLLTGAPVAGARIEASGATTATSAADGSYNLQSVQLNIALVVATRAGYDSTSTLLPLTGGDRILNFSLRQSVSATIGR
ncbi:MAG: carboxypeptidase-like regulatory domain-containing protein [Gemmatimonadota bacterium]